jgi:hypothetical protein
LNRAFDAEITNKYSVLAQSQSLQASTQPSPSETSTAIESDPDLDSINNKMHTRRKDQRKNPQSKPSRPPPPSKTIKPKHGNGKQPLGKDRKPKTVKKVLTKSDDEEMPKKYEHGDYDDDDCQEDELGEEYTEHYESDSYGDGDGEEGEEIEDHNLDKGEYENDEDVEERKVVSSPAKGRKARVSYDSDDDSESNISQDSLQDLIYREVP